MSYSFQNLVIVSHNTCDAKFIVKTTRYNQLLDALWVVLHLAPFVLYHVIMKLNQEMLSSSQPI